MLVCEIGVVQLRTDAFSKSLKIKILGLIEKYWQCELAKLKPYTTSGIWYIMYNGGGI